MCSPLRMGVGDRKETWSQRPDVTCSPKQPCGVVIRPVSTQERSSRHQDLPKAASLLVLGSVPLFLHGRSPTPAWALSHPHQGSLCLQALQMALASSRAKNCPSPAPNPPGHRAGPSPEQAQPFPPDPCPPATSEACPLWAEQLSGAETAKAAGLGPEGVCFRPGLYGAWAAEQQEPRGASPHPPDADLQLQGQ